MRYFRAILMASLVAGGVLAGAPWSSARADFDFYNDGTNFQIQPTKPAVMTAAVWRDFEHAWAQDFGAQAENASWNPVAQAPEFYGYGFDSEDQYGRLWNGETRIQTGTTVYVGPPWPFQRSINVSANAGNTAATASASVSVNEWFPPFGSFFGSLQVTGSANAPDLYDFAQAFSHSSLELWGPPDGWKNGHFVWKPWYSAGHTGLASAFNLPHFPWPRDPINVRLLDDQDNVLLEDTLLDIWTDITRGQDPQTSWQNGRLAFSGVLDGEFHARVDSPYITTSQRGTADLVFQDGLVTQSYDDGIFDGLLPPVGTPGTFDVPWLTSIEFDYDLPEMGTQIMFDMGIGEMPEPATLALMTLGAAGLLVRRRRR